MLRSKKNCNVVPSKEFDRTPFQRSVLKKVVQSVVDKYGNKISERVTSVAVSQKIPDDKFFDKEITADLFSIENLQESGVELTRVTAPFFTATIDDKSALVAHVENFDLDSLVDILPSTPPSINVESSKIE